MKKLVPRLIDRYNLMQFPTQGRNGKQLTSKNRVCGISVNVPIAKTCQPTKVCIDTCYYAKNTTAIENNLKKQTEVYWSIENDPVGSAIQIAKECKDTKHLRWNGGGDLTEKSTVAINYLANLRPDLMIWVVTRIPQYAVLIHNKANVFVHFSVDRWSKNRLKDLINLIDTHPDPPQWFVSYQCDKNEVLPPAIGESVLFYDNYKGGESKPLSYCPLNEISIQKDRTCIECRRCFSSESLKLKDEDKLRKWANEPKDIK